VPPVRLVGLCVMVGFVVSILAAASAAAHGTVAAWGYNHSGQLGDGTTANSDVPVAAALASGVAVTAVSSGELHSLALLSDGTVMAWGAGDVYGSSLEDSDVPVAVSGLSGVTAISTGASHSLALLENGTVMAWGTNDYGDLGDGTTKASTVPVAVRLPAGVTATAVSAGEYDSLALLSNGTVMAWGYNFSGQLGDGTTKTSDVPVAVHLAPGVTVSAISAGWEENLALLSNGTLMAWGNNSFGLLGDGTREGPEKCGQEGCSRVPVAVSGLSGITAISTSLDVSMALLEDGTVRAWGSNYDGQLGDGTTEASYLPVAVSGLGGVTAISTSLDVSLAVLEDGTVMAWGYNGYGGLGDATTTGPENCGGFYCSRMAVAVSELSGVTAISAGPDHNLAIGAPPPSITTAGLPEGQLGTGYSQTLAAIGGATPYTWSLLAGSLPAGLRLDAESGAILGTPTVAGTSSFTVEASDSSTPTPRTATANLSISIGPGGEQAAEYGQCVPERHGDYTGPDCLTKSARAKKGHFEWKPGPAPACVAQKRGKYSESNCETLDEKQGKPKGSFEREPGAGYTSKAGTVTLETPGLGAGKVVCAASTGAGEITGVKTGVETITFTGCETSGKKCTSEGPNSTPSGITGVIVTNLLQTRLVGPVAGQVRTELTSSEHEPYMVEFGCEGPLFRTIGSLGGVQTGDVNLPSLTSTTTFAIGEGEQALYTELSETGGALWMGPDPSSEVAVAANTAAEKTEIRT
jgi:alpha-tubulin suppressor-like RCC1 family protein